MAVVDDGGNLMALDRLDGTFAAASNIAIGKARTAAQFKKPTRFFEDVIAKGRTAMTALPDFTPLGGGLPLIVDGQVIGAVGVSGAASAKEDEELAADRRRRPAGRGRRPPRSISSTSRRVSAAFVKGEPLIETADYKVHASHRDNAGKAEVHTEDTDILYVLVRVGDHRHRRQHGRPRHRRAGRVSGAPGSRGRAPAARRGRRDDRAQGRAALVPDRARADRLLRRQGSIGTPCSLRRRFVAAFLLAAALAPARPPADPPLGRPDAIVDLATADGAALVGATWRVHEADLVAVDGRAPGPTSSRAARSCGPATSRRTPEVAGFDDGKWEAIDLGAPGTLPALEQRRGTGRVSFVWYRVTVTVPARIGAIDPTGATLAFETVLDDYAEIWVDGKLPVVLGQPGGNVVKGFGAPNRLILGRDVRPGQRFQIAIFAMNGPVSASPQNFIWVKSATLDVYKHPVVAVRDEAGSVLRLSPALDAIVPRDARVEKVAEGFLFTEGPVWHPDGYLLFSDPNANNIYRWTPDGLLSIYRTQERLPRARHRRPTTSPARTGSRSIPPGA